MTDTPEPTERPTVDAVIGDKYRLASEVGVGGMGTVWRAEHVTLHHDVAVKFIDLKGVNPAKAKKRFLQEARTAALVRHRHVVDIIDFGTTSDDRPYMVMEFLTGRSLASVLEERGVLPVSEMLHVAFQVLSALGAVHEAGIVHYDMKPENIYVMEEEGELFVKLLDFGISRIHEPASGTRRSFDDNTLTEGLVVGTPEYMSPEQARGLKEIDLRTDLYSLAIIMYEALMGRCPYQEEHVGDTLVAVIRGGALPIDAERPELRPLADILSLAMSVAPTDRYQSAREMKTALLAATAELGPGVEDVTARFGASLRPGAGFGSGVDIPAQPRLPSELSSDTLSEEELLAQVEMLPDSDRAEVLAPQAPQKRKSAFGIYLALGSVGLVLGVGAYMVSNLGADEESPADRQTESAASETSRTPEDFETPVPPPLNEVSILEPIEVETAVAAGNEEQVSPELASSMAERRWGPRPRAERAAERAAMMEGAAAEAGGLDVPTEPDPAGSSAGEPAAAVMAVPMTDSDSPIVRELDF